MCSSSPFPYVNEKEKGSARVWRAFSQEPVLQMSHPSVTAHSLGWALSTCLSTQGQSSCSSRRPAGLWNFHNPLPPHRDEAYYLTCVLFCFLFCFPWSSFFIFRRVLYFHHNLTFWESLMFSTHLNIAAPAPNKCYFPVYYLVFLLTKLCPFLGFASMRHSLINRHAKC